MKNIAIKIENGVQLASLKTIADISGVCTEKLKYPVLATMCQGNGNMSVHGMHPIDKEDSIDFFKESGYVILAMEA